MYIINLLQTLKTMHIENPEIMERAKGIEKIVEEECNKNRFIDPKTQSEQALKIYAKAISIIHWSFKEPEWNNDAKKIFWYMDAITDLWYEELNAKIGRKSIEKMIEERNITIL